jgi:Ras-related protein Rab-2A
MANLPISSPPKWQYSFKLILLGDPAVGKTTICRQYMDEHYLPTYSSTIGIEYGCKHLTIRNTPIKLHIWDTAGAEVYRSIARSYYRDTAGVLLIYDISDRTTFTSIVSWLTEIRRHLPEESSIILVGNKKDLVKKEVSTEEGKRFAEENGLLFVEISAKEYKSVSELFITISNKIYDDLQKHIISYGMEKIPTGVRTPDHPNTNSIQFTPVNNGFSITNIATTLWPTWCW